ncbi:YqzL family protein [Bacillaceae bacterium Marseille-Q3522]|nr:YqzL family protein [Bacillaceae bacterium Marseille-Q3522]
MLEFTWNLFLKTGSIDTYLLIKEMEKDGQETANEQTKDLTEADIPFS